MQTLLAALLAALCSFAAHAQKVAIGHMPVTNQVEVVAAQMGFYKKHGIDVELKLFQTGPSAMQALLAGDLQMVEAGGAPMWNLAAQNLPLYFLISGGINTPKNPAGAIMVRADDTAIKTFADLKGKKLGGLPKGTITELWLYNAVALHNFRKTDLQEVVVPFPQMGALLASKNIDAVYAWPPFTTLISQAGQGKVLTDDSAWNPYAVINGMIVRRDWAEKNADALKRLIKAQIEAGRWINDNQAQAREIIGKSLKLPEAAYKEMGMFHFPRNGYQLMPSIWDFYHLMVKSGQLKPFPDPKAVVNAYWYEPAAKFITPALTEVGRQDDPIVRDALKIRLMNLSGDLSQYLGPWER
jgi:ABC-type nitrate/sulfonate/bicarbonate transport system substrate-binding protein